MESFPALFSQNHAIIGSSPSIFILNNSYNLSIYIYIESICIIWHLLPCSLHVCQFPVLSSDFSIFLHGSFALFVCSRKQEYLKPLRRSVGRKNLNLGRCKTPTPLAWLETCDFNQLLAPFCESIENQRVLLWKWPFDLAC